MDELESPRYKRLASIKYLIESGHLDTFLRWRQRATA